MELQGGYRGSFRLVLNPRGCSPEGNSIEAPLCAPGFLDKATWGSELLYQGGEASLGGRGATLETSELESRAWEGGRRPWGGMYRALVPWTHPVGGPTVWILPGLLSKATPSPALGFNFYFQLLVTVQPLVESS